MSPRKLRRLFVSVVVVHVVDTVPYSVDDAEITLLRLRPRMLVCPYCTSGPAIGSFGTATMLKEALGVHQGWLAGIVTSMIQRYFPAYWATLMVPFGLL